MARIVVDPVTRIEGHVRIEAEVNSGAVSDAWSSGTVSITANQTSSANLTLRAFVAILNY
jgi:hypothetical protein